MEYLILQRENNTPAGVMNPTAGFVSPHKCTGCFLNMRDLIHARYEGIHYTIRTKQGVSSTAVLAIHGGNIEPGTTELAEEIADSFHGFYSFIGLGSVIECRELHITSTRFDDLKALAIAPWSAACN